MPGKILFLRQLGFIFLTLTIIINACLPAAAREKGSNSIIIGNLERTYEIFVPDGKKGLPVVFNLHGGGSWGKRMCNYTAFPALAKTEDFIVVCPDGIDGNWNDGRKNMDTRAHRENIDDLGFISALIDKLSKDYAIERKRVFVTGISNGGIMAFRLACRLSDKIRAIAPVAGSIPVDWDCNPKNNVPMLLLGGTGDPIVPWEGGLIGPLFQKRGNIYSFEKAFQIWGNLNKCPETSEWQALPDIKPDGTRVYKREKSGCAGNTEVLLYKVEKGGHTWPGAFEYSIFQELLVGKTSYDINATSLIWEFFKKFK
jgi:polyhydroxybutyrate depolymerase